ncbi:putative reverse transcriptase domain-containing protein, partial [Tanacetum coccineum]
ESETKTSTRNVHDYWSSVKDKILAAPYEASKVENVTAKMMHGLDQLMERKEDEEDYKMKNLARIYIDEIVVGHGVLVSIILNRDGRFTLRFWQTLQKALGTRPDMSTAYHPQKDGQKFSYNNSYHSSIRCAPFGALYRRKCRSPVLWAKIGESMLIGLELVQETTDKVVFIKEKLKAARDCQKSYADNRRKLLEFEVADQVLLKVSPWKGVVDKTLHFVEEPVEIIDREVKSLKHSRIPIVKVHWNLKRGHEDFLKSKYPHLLVEQAIVRILFLPTGYSIPEDLEEEPIKKEPLEEPNEEVTLREEHLCCSRRRATNEDGLNALSDFDSEIVTIRRKANVSEASSRLKKVLGLQVVLLMAKERDGVDVLSQSIFMVQLREIEITMRWREGSKLSNAFIIDENSIDVDMECPVKLPVGKAVWDMHAIEFDLHPIRLNDMKSVVCYCAPPVTACYAQLKVFNEYSMWLRCETHVVGYSLSLIAVMSAICTLVSHGLRRAKLLNSKNILNTSERKLFPAKRGVTFDNHNLSSLCYDIWDAALCIREVEVKWIMKKEMTIDFIAMAQSLDSPGFTSSMDEEDGRRGIRKKRKRKESEKKRLNEGHLVKLWDLVKERFSTTEPTDDKEKELWVELKRLFEPDYDDTLWKLQRYMHDPLVWRLYDTCGVHHVSSVRGHDIFMLVEKEYPLTRGLMTVMLANKLQVD